MKTICNMTTTHTRYDHRVFLKECITEKQNYEVCLVVSDGKPDEIKDGIHVYSTPKHKTRLGRAIFSAFQVYRKAKSLKADIYVFHEHDLLWLALFLKKRNNFVIWDCHEAYFYDLSLLSGRLKGLRYIILFLFNVISHIVVRHLDGCITVCKDIKIWLTNLGCKSCFLLPNYALKREFSSLVSPNYTVNQRVFFVGAFNSSRSIHSLVQAIGFCKYKNVKLVLVGCRAKKQYLDYCKQLSGWDQVEYHSGLTREEWQQKSQTCFAAICAYSYHKKMGVSRVKLYEYMACSLPIIFATSISNDVHENLLNNDGHPLGLVVDSDPQAIANAIDYLYENKEVARTMGMNGRKAFETKYNFESEAGGFLKFLEEVSQSKNKNK